MDYTVNKHSSKIYRTYYAHECLVGMKEETQYIFRNGKIPIPPLRATFSPPEQPHRMPVNFWPRIAFFRADYFRGRKFTDDDLTGKEFRRHGMSGPLLAAPERNWGRWRSRRKIARARNSIPILIVEFVWLTAAAPVAAWKKWFLLRLSG